MVKCLPVVMMMVKMLMMMIVMVVVMLLQPLGSPHVRADQDHLLPLSKAALQP